MNKTKSHIKSLFAALLAFGLIYINLTSSNTSIASKFDVEQGSFWDSLEDDEFDKTDYSFDGGHLSIGYWPNNPFLFNSLPKTQSLHTGFSSSTSGCSPKLFILFHSLKLDC